MLSPKGGMRGLRLLIGILLLLILLGVIEAWFLATATGDPYGLSGAPPLRTADVGAIEPLYGKTWTQTNVLAWSPDGRHLAVADQDVQVIDAYTGEITAEWTTPGWPGALAWSPDGETLAVGVSTAGFYYEGWVILYDLRGVPLVSWRAVDQGLAGLAWSPWGDRILAAGTSEYTMWTNTGILLYRYTNASTTGYTASWSPDGRRIALADAGGPLIINASTGATIRAFSGDDWMSAVWSPRGNRIAAGDGSGLLEVLDANGTVLANASGFYGGSIFGMPISWSPDGSMLVTLSSGGIIGSNGLAIVSTSNLTTLRVLTFPMSEFLSSAPPLPTYDYQVAWSPSGSTIAATGTTSHPSLRIWGIHHETLGLPLLAFGAATALGLGLLLWREVLWLAVSPDRAGLLWARTDPKLRTGSLLFLFGLVSSILGSLGGNALSRIYSLQPVPSATWYAFNGLLSAPTVLLAAAVAAVTFHAMVWRVESLRPFAERRLSLYGYVLLPFLLAIGVGDAVDGLLLLAFPTMGRGIANPLIWGSLGVVLGLGFAYSGRVVRGFPWARSRFPWVALGASAVASIGVLLALLVLLVIPLNLFQVHPPGGDFATYGFSIFLGFGFVPLVAVLLALVTTTAIAALPTVLRFAPSGYARVQGSAILELETRRKVLDLIVAQPGIHFRGLLKSTGLGSGTLHYHLSVLEREGYVRHDREGRVKRFFAKRPVGTPPGPNPIETL